MIHPPRHMSAIDGLLSFHLYSLAAWCGQHEMKTKGNTHVLDQHEALSIRDDLGRVQCLLQVG